MQRKKYTKEFKEQVIKEAMETGNSSVVARRYDLNSNMVARWVREFKNGKYGLENGSTEANPTFNDVSQENKQLSQENEQLKKLLGEKDLEIAILRDLLKKTSPHLLQKLK
ncbi:MAG: transposase [Clostridia bacterium]|nr:transposase [Clostridia bacterium]